MRHHYHHFSTAYGWMNRLRDERGGRLQKKSFHFPCRLRLLILFRMAQGDSNNRAKNIEPKRRIDCWTNEWSNERKKIIRIDRESDILAHVKMHTQMHFGAMRRERNIASTRATRITWTNGKKHNFTDEIVKCQWWITMVYGFCANGTERAIHSPTHTHQHIRTRIAITQTIPQTLFHSLNAFTSTMNTTSDWEQRGVYLRYFGPIWWLCVGESVNPLETIRFHSIWRARNYFIIDVVRTYRG